MPFCPGFHRWIAIAAVLLILPMMLVLPGCSGCSKKAGDTAVKKTTKRNVILISVDTLRADELGCYGSTDGLTSGLDGLAKVGLQFENVTACAPWTLPSHASMLTGVYPFVHHAVDGLEAFDEKVFYLPQYLQSQGFATGAFVTVIFVDKRFGFGRGMDHFELLENEPPRLVAGKALSWIEKQTKPFFCFLHLFTPHEPYDPPAEMLRRYAPNCPEGVQPSFSRQAAISRDPKALQCRRELYRTEIARTDKVLKNFLLKLREAGLNDNTLVIFTADHGESFLEHGVMGHAHSLFQEVISVPLILSGPGIPRGIKNPAPVSHVDLVPTTLAWLGYPTPPSAQGINILDERKLVRRTGVYSSVFLRSLAAVALNVGRYKYIHMIRSKMGDATLDHSLFDLKLDPREQNNLVETKPAIAQRMRKIIFERPELAERTAYQVRYKGNGGLGRVTASLRCDGPIIACNIIDYHDEKDPRSGSHYKRTEVSQTKDFCTAELTPENSPDTFVIVPKVPNSRCSATFMSSHLSARALARRIVTQDTKPLLNPTVSFPVLHPLPKDQGAGTIAVGEGTILTLQQPLLEGELAPTVYLNATQREQLRSLGYLQ